MVIGRTNPSGIDWYIQNVQQQLHDGLITKIGVQNTSTLMAYGRCYRNKEGDRGYVAEVYVGNNEYKEVYWDDSLSMIFFFGVGSTVKVNLSNEADVHLVVFADLAKLQLTDTEGGMISHRADEELRGIFQQIIGKTSRGFQITEVETGIENVLREYPGSRRDERLKAVDMHPVHAFRINFKLLYKANKTC